MYESPSLKLAWRNFPRLEVFQLTKRTYFFSRVQIKLPPTPRGNTKKIRHSKRFSGKWVLIFNISNIACYKMVECCPHFDFPNLRLTSWLPTDDVTTAATWKSHGEILHYLRFHFSKWIMTPVTKPFTLENKIYPNVSNWWY